MTITVESAKKHIGKEIEGFYDSHGNPIGNIYMEDHIEIRMSDGSSVHLSIDRYGAEAYISQKDAP